jgi:Domain of unknown function (DUF4864)
MGRHLIAVLIFLCATSAQGQPVNPNDARAVRQVIEAQLDAFRRDDAKGAFSYATASIRSMFETPDNFLRMVKSQYPMVYRPAGVAFGEVRVIDGQLTQTVVFTDSENQRWLALYPMERLADGKTWRIDGCIVERVEPPKRSRGYSS